MLENLPYIGIYWRKALVTGVPSSERGQGTFNSHRAVAAVSHVVTGAVIVKPRFTPLPHAIQGISMSSGLFDPWVRPWPPWSALTMTTVSSAMPAWPIAFTTTSSAASVLAKASSCCGEPQPNLWPDRVRVGEMDEAQVGLVLHDVSGGLRGHLVGHHRPLVLDLTVAAVALGDVHRGGAAIGELVQGIGEHQVAKLLLADEHCGREARLLGFGKDGRDM